MTLALCVLSFAAGFCAAWLHAAFRLHRAASKPTPWPTEERP